MITYYERRYKGELRALFKIENGTGYIYENGEWVEDDYIKKALYEDIGVDKVDPKEVNNLIKELN